LVDSLIQKSLGTPSFFRLLRGNRASRNKQGHQQWDGGKESDQAQPFENKEERGRHD
jgi:hypothetical protein